MPSELPAASYRFSAAENAALDRLGLMLAGADGRPLSRNAVLRVLIARAAENLLSDGKKKSPKKTAHST